MKMARIEKLAVTGELEVEHLLAALRCREPDAAQRLLRMSSQHGWHEVSEAARQAMVPFGTWARIVSTCLSSGIEGLAVLAEDSVNTPFVLAVLEQLNDIAAVQGVLTIFKNEMKYPENSLDVSVRIASALNQILSFKTSPRVSDAEAQQIRNFLMKLYPYVGTEVDRASVVLAFRGVGNEETLEFLTAAKAFSGAWSEVKATTVRSIEQRISANAGYGRR